MATSCGDESARDNGCGVEQSDEIDLFKLWEDLIREKMTVILSVITIVTASIFYVSLVIPTFESKAYFIPVEKESVQKIMAWDRLLGRQSSFSTLELFNIFKQNISSRSVLWEFFVSNKLYAIYDIELAKVQDINSLKNRKKIQETFEQFIQGLLVNESKDNGLRKYLSVSLAMPLSEKAVQKHLENYVSQVREKTRREVLSTIKNEQESRIEQLKQKIKTMREIAKDYKADRLAQLDEAITIARSLSLKEPPELGAKATIQGVSNQGLPLYYLGYRLLEAERKVLDRRQSNDPFITGLRGLQEELSILSTYNISMDDFFIVRLDQAASVGEKIKPVKTLILAAAVVLGLMLGIFIALIKVAYTNRKPN